METIDEIADGFSEVYRQMVIERVRLEGQLERLRDPADEEHF